MNHNYINYLRDANVAINIFAAYNSYKFEIPKARASFITSCKKCYLGFERAVNN